MKKIMVLFLAAVFVFAFAGAALAAYNPDSSTPSVIDPATGASAWTYQDSQDGTAKTEGSYAAFNASDTAGNGIYSFGDLSSTANYDESKSGPHGGYDTTTNKCKVCHAVHRAEGAYFLMRADTQDDACDYCHIQGAAHSELIVYELNSAGKNTTNGHTIGASAAIPDSSVDQWLENVTLSTVSENGSPLTETVQVRRYDAEKNKMFRFAKQHGHNAVGVGEAGYLRIGPLALRCMNCHQPHNAKNMVWKPTAFSAGDSATYGYKLLRKMPSGSIKPGTSTNTAGNWDIGDVISVPEEIMTAANTGHDAESGSTDPSNGKNTIYTAFTGSNTLTVVTDRPQTINQYTLSPWCADCHNLNIGYWKHLTNQELGYKSHADRTHPVPYTGNGEGTGPGQCYSCHRNDMPISSTGDAMHCSRCHFGPTAYSAYHDGALPGSTKDSDFPHSGQENSIKLLGVWTAQMNDAGSIIDDTTTSVTADTIDGVCLRCHTGIGTNH